MTKLEQQPDHAWEVTTLQGWTGIEQTENLAVANETTCNDEILLQSSMKVFVIQGSIRAKRVVNATGFWGREFSSLVPDYNVPLAPIQHQYVVSKSVPELKELPCELPVLRHLDASFYLRLEKDISKVVLVCHQENPLEGWSEMASWSVPTNQRKR